MDMVDHGAQPVEEWRPGVRTRMRVSARMGAVQLCVFEQWCDRGCGAPAHRHGVEEVLEVLVGEAEVWVEGEVMRVSARQSVIVPTGRRHGFRNVGGVQLHVLAILASPFFQARFDDGRETSTRWAPQA